MIKEMTSLDLKNFLFAQTKDYGEYCNLITSLKTRIKYFEVGNDNWWSNAKHYYFLKLVDGEIVGVLNYIVYKKTPDINGCWHLFAYISVDKRFKRQGISKELIGALVKSKKFKPSLGICGVTGYTTEGFNYVRPQIQKLIDNGLKFEMHNFISHPEQKKKKKTFFQKIIDKIKKVF